MTIYMKKIFILLSAAIIAPAAFVACNLTEVPKSDASVDMVFGSKAGLQVYAYSFYENLPTKTDVYKLDATTDYGPKNNVSGMEVGAYTPESASSWSWTKLRNINYFLEQNVNPNVDETSRNHFNGIARLFRAYFYFDKLVQYGPVPWIEKVFNSPEDEGLKATRDTRDDIIEKIIADLDFAYANITTADKTGNSAEVNKWTALALKTRICLFEASWRKYHANDKLDFAKTGCDKYSPATLFGLAAEAAKTIMDNSPYTLHTGNYVEGGRGAYRDLFVSDNACTDEVMLAVVADETKNIGEQNWWYNSSTYGPHLGMSRKFAKSYLNIDGTPYSELNPDGSYKNFIQETTGRDTRLNQTIRAYDYSRKNAAGAYERTAANFTGHALSGYQVTKWVMDDISYDDHSSNGNDEPLIRYAEILLAYAEAKAETGSLTDDDWKDTIGALRERAGITGGTNVTGTLTKKPTDADPYMQAYYPGVNDPVILEIRRERAIELAYEGLRLQDLKRWACCNLWVDDPWDGIFVPEIEKPLDINGDGVDDVYYTTDSKSVDSKYKALVVEVALGGTTKNKVNLVQVDGGYIYRYPVDKEWPERQYLYPISQTDMQMNENLKQNPGW